MPRRLWDSWSGGENRVRLKTRGFRCPFFFSHHRIQGRGCIEYYSIISCRIVSPYIYIYISVVLDLILHQEFLLQ
jgi:hypothetical protein